MNKIITNQNGGIAIITALLLTAFLGLAALGIDSGYMVATKNELQNAADAGALAGAWQLSKGGDEDAIKNTAKDTVGQNKASNDKISLELSDITIGKWDLEEREFTISSLEDANAVKVSIQNHDLNLFFKPGNESLGAQAIAIASGGGMTGVRPIATDVESIEDLKIDEQFVVYGKGFSAGNWGTVNLDGSKGGNDHKLEAWMQDGYDGIIGKIGFNPGAGFHKYIDIIQELIDNKVQVPIPVVKDFPPGSSGKREVLRFVKIQFKAISGKTAKLKIEAIYLGPVEYVGGGGASGSGHNNIVLVK